MKNGIMFRIDTDFQSLLKDVQVERVELGTDKNKKNLTILSYLAWKILKEDDNLTKLLTMKVIQ